MTGPHRGLARLGWALLLASCAVLPSAPGRLVIPGGADPAGGARRVAELAEGADVVYLGESHDNPHHHRAQAQVVEAVLARGARPTLAFEMVPETEQARIHDVLARADTAAEGDRRLRWTARGWPDFAMYWPLFDAARRHRLAVVGIDLDPALTRRIAREGLEALGTDARDLSSRLGPDPAREAAIARTMQSAHCDLLPAARIPRMVESWHARNVTIARRLATALEQADGARPRVIVIIGRGHQDAGGVPDQLAALRPGTRQLAVALMEVGPREQAEEVIRSTRGDVVWLTPPVEREDPCARLRNPGRPGLRSGAEAPLSVADRSGMIRAFRDRGRGGRTDDAGRAAGG
jgi:uncharacterized iron-regulated protein